MIKILSARFVVGSPQTWLVASLLLDIVRHSITQGGFLSSLLFCVFIIFVSNVIPSLYQVYSDIPQSDTNYINAQILQTISHTDKEFLA